jgi:hypothetical protein
MIDLVWIVYPALVTLVLVLAVRADFRRRAHRRRERTLGTAAGEAASD